MKIDIEEKLEQLGLKSITEIEKNLLWSKITRGFYAEHAREAVTSAGRRSLLSKVLNFRTALASLLVVSFLTGSTIVAADSAKPGDLLFPVDIAIENVRIIIAVNEKKDELRIKFAGERLGEAKIILAILTSESVGTHTTATSSVATSTHASQGTNSTSTATTTPWSGKEKVRGNLAVALLHLEQTKLDLANRGNQAGVLAIENIINELTKLAETRIDDFEKIKAEIKSDGRKVRVEVEAKGEGIKAKFKFRSDSSNSTTTSWEIRTERNSTSTMKARTERDDRKKEDNKNDEDEDEEDDDEDDDRGSKHEDKKVKVCHTSFFRIHRTLEISRAAVDAHLAHGDTIGECDGNDDITTPVISNITTNAGTTTARVNWNTNEVSNSKVWYATGTPLVLGGSTLSKSSSDKVASHSLALSGLTASTTYYFVVASTDAEGLTATSSTLSFVTLSGEIPDTTAPVISNITATVSTTTATVSWNTNEASNGSVWYATTTPLSLSSVPNATNTSFTLTHPFTLSGLTASTTYYFVVKSADIAGNTATSGERSFTTLGE